MIDSTGPINNNVVQPQDTVVSVANEEEQASVSSGIATEEGGVSLLEGQSTTNDNNTVLEEEVNLPYPGREEIESQVFSNLLTTSIDNLSKLNQLDANIDLDIINPFDGAVILSRMRGVMSEFNALLGIQTVGQSYSVLSTEQQSRLIAAIDKKALSEEAAEIVDDLSVLTEELSDLESQNTEIEENENEGSEEYDMLQEEIARLKEEIDVLLLNLSTNAELQVVEQEIIDLISTEFLQLRSGSLLKSIQLQYGKGDAEEATGEEAVAMLEAQNTEMVRKMREEHLNLKKSSDEQIRYNKKNLNNSLALKEAVLHNNITGVGAEVFSLVGALQKKRAETNVVNNVELKTAVPKTTNDKEGLTNDEFLRERITMALLAGVENAQNTSKDTQKVPINSNDELPRPKSLNDFTRQVTQNMLAEGIGDSAKNVSDQVYLDKDTQKSINNLEMLMALDVLRDLEQSVSSQLLVEKQSQKDFELARSRTLG